MYDNISKDNNSKFPKFGNGVESGRTVLLFVLCKMLNNVVKPISNEHVTLCDFTI